MKKQILSEEFRRMQKLAGIINETLFTPSEVDGEQIYTIEYNGKKFEFSYQEYDDAYICSGKWSEDVAELAKHLRSQGVKLTIDVAPEKTIIIKKDEFEKFIK